MKHKCTPKKSNSLKCKWNSISSMLQWVWCFQCLISGHKYKAKLLDYIEIYTVIWSQWGKCFKGQTKGQHSVEGYLYSSTNHFWKKAMIVVTKCVSYKLYYYYYYFQSRVHLPSSNHPLLAYYSIGRKAWRHQRDNQTP
jgi:hypothetical protein